MLYLLFLLAMIFGFIDGILKLMDNSNKTYRGSENLLDFITRKN